MLVIWKWIQETDWKDTTIEILFTMMDELRLTMKQKK